MKKDYCLKRDHNYNCKKRWPIGLIAIGTSTMLSAGIVNANALENTEIIETLVQNKNFDVNKTDAQGRTYLHLAAINGKNKLIKILIKKDIAIDKRDNQLKTALHYTVEYKHYDTAKLLVNSDANISLVDRDGNTPLSLYLKQIKRQNTAQTINPDIKILLMTK